MSEPRLRVLLVPDSVYWVTGTIAKSIARFNPWIEATVASGPVLDTILNERPDLIANFDLVHFVCPYASKQWLPRFQNAMPCVTSHHHVTDWELIKHNLEGDAMVVGSPEWAADLQARGADSARVFCVPYGVDAEKFTPATEAEKTTIRKTLNLAADALVVGFFGKNSSNDDDRKGIDIFSKAILALHESAPRVAVLVVGPGWDQLVQSFRAAGVNCLWFPFIRELDGLGDMYRALEFYWVTARVEGGPVTLLEAMSSEVCCLTTAVGIAREIVRAGENALLLPFNDPQVFVERTLELAHDPDRRRRLGRNARQTILETMHVGITARQVRAVYAKAFENFERRQPVGATKHAPRWSAIDSATNPRDAGEEVPLHGFPASLHARARMLETLTWAEHLLLYHRQRSVSLKLILGEWMTHPLSPLPPRVLLRRFLPTAVVARVVKLKNRRPGPAPGYAKSVAP